MTPEERAKDATALMVKKLPGTGIALVMEDQDKCAALIASAIRDAEDAAYERAAAICERHARLAADEGQETAMMAITFPMLEIRALKSKGT